MAGVKAGCIQLYHVAVNICDLMWLLWQVMTLHSYKTDFLQEAMCNFWPLTS